MSVLECPKPKVDPAAVPTRYAIEDSIAVQGPPPRDGALALWVPLIPDTPSQRVLDLVIEADCAWSVTREPEFGNQMLHVRAADAPHWPLEIRLRYHVERLPLVHSLHPACARPLATPALFARDLAAEQFVEVSDRTRALAGTIVGDERNPLEQARRVYRYVTDTMTYDAPKQSWKGSTDHALVCSTGNCNDIHALFISLVRSMGIPARLVTGQALESPPQPGADTCEVCGYHCWAAFFVAGLGWIPVDASCACKYGTEGLFGALETNHVAWAIGWAIGRDLIVAPAQQGPRLLFLAGPYAEVDGQPYRAVERRLTFAEQ
ncbi:MAG: transglutaminase family protein [Acidobacteria bacterium]|nr:transglutaminase family protein [Acidobacteriota bacterium]